MSNNSGTAKVKIVKNERDPPLFTSKQLIKLKQFSETQLKLSYDIGFVYRRMDGRTDMVKPVYPPTTSLRGV